MSASNFALIPVSQAADEEVEQVFSNTFFGNVSTFVAMFNAGVLNRSYDENKDFSELVEKSYSNVYKNKNMLVVQSPEEYLASELASVFTDWKTISRLRRELNEGVENNSFNRDTVLYLASNGAVYTVDTERKQMFSCKLGRLTKDSMRRILELSTLRQGELFLEEYSEEENPELNEFSLEGDTLVINEGDNVDEEEEEEDEVDVEGKELPENAPARSVKVSDIVDADDNFISLAYEAVSAGNN